MTKDTYPRLCGGTFFTLVLQALRQRMSAREHYDGDSDGLSDPEVLVGLIKVVNPTYTDPGKERLKTIVNNYKRCKSSTSTYLPFNDNQVITAFDEAVRTDYQTVLNRMIAFVYSFIDLSESVRKDRNLVKALIDLIQQDESVLDEDEFFIEPDGSEKKKAALGDLEKVCFPAFLLGVWHYIIENRRNNSVGEDTYNKWCPSVGGGLREYSAHMGEGILRDLNTYMVEMEDRTEQNEDPIETKIISDIPDDTKEEKYRQTVNNPVIFNFTQNGNNNTQIGHVERYYAGNKEDT